MNVGSLFAGIGGFDLGFERAGMRTEWFVEREPYCQRVLAKHWPGVPIFDDVCEVGVRNLPAVDVLCGGFPCQDISGAGKGAGLDGARSGLWSEFARLIGELQPRWVVVENVAALRHKGKGLFRVLGDLAACGYDAEWDCIPASAVGAPHRRDRIWIVGYPNGTGPQGHGRPVAGTNQWLTAATGRGSRALRCDGRLADADRKRCSTGRETGDLVEEVEHTWAHGSQSRNGCSQGHAWCVEPDVGRVAHGVPARVDRLRALGNALVPQIAEWIGHRIMEYERCAS